LPENSLLTAFFMISSLRVRRSSNITTFGFKMDLKFRILVLKNFYLGEFCLKQNFRGIIMVFVTAPARKHQYYYFRFQSGSQIQISRDKKLIQAGILPENCILKAFFMI
jgi:hypothetical protein